MKQTTRKAIKGGTKMPLYNEEQKIEELKITFECVCGNKLVYFSWDENMGDNPYVDVKCKCGIYYKKRGSIRKNGEVGS